LQTQYAQHHLAITRSRFSHDQKSESNLQLQSVASYPSFEAQGKPAKSY
jgi:hypothetical protein